MTGRHLNAHEALEWGWLNRMWPLSEFDERAGEYVETLAQLPTVAVGAFKSMLNYSVAHGLRDSLAHELELATVVQATEDSREGRLSFQEKRAPVFRGR